MRGMDKMVSDWSRAASVEGYEMRLVEEKQGERSRAQEYFIGGRSGRARDFGPKNASTLGRLLPGAAQSIPHPPLPSLCHIQKPRNSIEGTRSTLAKYSQFLWTNHPPRLPQCVPLHFSTALSRLETFHDKVTPTHPVAYFPPR